MRFLYLYAFIVFLAICNKLKGHELGDVVEKYESAGHPCVIGNINGDPGGKSYGLYQFSLNKGTMQKFLKEYGSGLGLSGHKAGTKEFDRLYQANCKIASEGFKVAQRGYAVKYYFKPARKYANTLNIAFSKKINEALFSLAIQHGGYKKIIRATGLFVNEDDWLYNLYTARLQYVYNLSLPQKIKRAIAARYQLEYADLYRIQEDMTHGTY